MKNFNQPPYELGAIAVAIITVCKLIDCDCPITTKNISFGDVRDACNMLANKLGITPRATNEMSSFGFAIQDVIDALLSAKKIGSDEFDRIYNATLPNLGK